MINKSFDNKRYEIPYSFEERFDFLANKILYAKKDGYIELERGLWVVFRAEFDQYENNNSRHFFFK